VGQLCKLYTIAAISVGEVLARLLVYCYSMQILFKIICYLACATALFLAVYSEMSAKNLSGKAMRLIAQETRPEGYEDQLRVLQDQASDKTRLGLVSAAIGAVLTGVCFYYIKPKGITDSVGAGLLKATLIIMLIFYTILKLAAV
jgi:hypothetical protein